ncbi:hypothetical protein KIH31_01890 [Paenarthrobacter sp. DKR-5]|uniref:hypothetical protein n=1 Tax=Paenarthrobacter sp. DKR-5 TaxID=2835535 RepID=UPI001BDCFBD6|nr:hypothetical protein [Paenarthrobacter sp. DKR-5]MBT1001342.1 hypothetical protein [Paenarthrobacter sp. DKR-5]
MTEPRVDGPGHPGIARQPEQQGQPGPAFTRKPLTGNVAVQGPFTLRDLVVFGSVLVMFIGSLLPTFGAAGFRINLWSAGGLYFVGVGILFPLAVAALFALRRLSPSRVRIGSLSLDQFGSVVAVVSGAFFFVGTVSSFSWGFLIALIGSLGFLAATTFAPMLPFFAGEFADRPEAPAHAMARDAVAPAARPAPAKPAQGQAAQGAPAQGAGAGAAAHGGALSGHNAPAPRFSGATAYRPESAQHAPSAAGAAPAAGAAAAAGASPAGAAPVAGQAPEAGQAPAGATAAAPAPEPSASGAPATQAFPSAGTAAPAATGAGTAAGAPAAGAPAEAPSEEQAARPTAGADVPTAAIGTVPAAAAQAEAGHARATSIGATVDPSAKAAEPTYEAFWFAVGQSRPIVDERSGSYLFTIEPGAWVLALQDRGHEFLVQNTDGQVGVLRDLRNIERA